jgi:TP901 family phage tail tape measure protein
VALIGAGHSLGGFAGGNVTARLVVAVSGNTRELQTALAGASGSIESFGQGASRLGNALTRNITLPLLGLGAAALALAAGFERSMARVAGLTPLFDDQKHSIEGVSSALIDMSKKTGTSARELADALYFAGSAGLSFGEAMDVVELSAKGAAIGMGEAKDISKVLIFALNTFRSQGLTAASAMDTLTVAIKEGTAEPDELAIALGRLLPVAKEVGLSFGEVVGSVAALTNIGIPTRVATTSLRALFTELLAPTKQANDQLIALGLTAQQVRDAVAAGPVVAFNLLKTATKGNIDALHQIVPQIRGFTALLGLTGDQAERVNQIYKATRDSTGALGRAFDIISRTKAFQFQKALVDLQAAGIELGRALFPVFKVITNALFGVADAFQELPGGMKTAAAAGLVLAASMGPLLKIFGAITGQGRGMFSSFQSTAVGLSVMAVAAIAAYTSFNQLFRGATDLQHILVTSIGTFVAVTVALKSLVAVANTGKLGINAITYAIGTLGSAGIVGIAVGVTALTVAIAYFAGKSHEGSRAAGQLAESLHQLGTDAVLSKDKIDQIAQGNKVLGDTFLALARAAKVVGQPIQTALGQIERVGLDKTADAVQRIIDRMESLGGRPSAELLKYAGILNKFRGANISVGEALRRSGEDEKEFFGALRQDIPGLTTDATAELYKMAGGAENLARTTDASAVAWKKLRDETEANILVHAAESTAVDKLARSYGVSTDFIQRKLSDYSVTAIGVMDPVTGKLNEQGEQWGELTGIIESSTGRQIAAETEAAEIEAKLLAERTENLQKTFTLFDELPEKIGKSYRGLLKQLGSQRGLFEQQAQDVQTLLGRGLDPAVLQKLVDLGPRYVHAFVSASKPELNQLEENYRLTMAAIDATVLQEGKHQEGKATDMISNFAQALESNRRLPVAAMQDLVNRMATAVDSKKIGQAGLDAIQSFVAAVTGPGALNLSGQAAVNLINAFANGLVSGKLDEAGRTAVQNFATAVGQNHNITRTQAASLVTDFIKRVERGDFEHAGVETIKKYAAGLQKNQHLSEDVAGQVAIATAKALGFYVEVAGTTGQLVITAYSKGIDNKKAAAFAQANQVGLGSIDHLKIASSGAFNIGKGFVVSFTSGMKAATSNVKLVASSIGVAAKTALNQSLYGSPKYFTYYAGMDLVKQMQEGINKAPTPTLRERPRMHVDMGTSLPGSATGEEHRSVRAGDVLQFTQVMPTTQDIIDAIGFAKRVPGGYRRPSTWGGMGRR